MTSGFGLACNVPTGKGGKYMDPGVVGVFIPILGMLGFFGLIGLKIWTYHKLQMREMPDGDNKRLTEAVQQLSD